MGYPCCRSSLQGFAGICFSVVSEAIANNTAIIEPRIAGRHDRNRRSPAILSRRRAFLESTPFAALHSNRFRELHHDERHADADEHRRRDADDGHEHGHARHEVHDGVLSAGRHDAVQDDADAGHGHGHAEELLPADEQDDGLRHAHDDELQRHADDVLHLLISGRGNEKGPAGEPAGPFVFRGAEKCGRTFAIGTVGVGAVVVSKCIPKFL